MTEMASPALPTQEEQVTYLKNAWSNLCANRFIL